MKTIPANGCSQCELFADCSGRGFFPCLSWVANRFSNAIPKKSSRTSRIRNQVLVLVEPARYISP